MIINKSNFSGVCCKKRPDTELSVARSCFPFRGESSTTCLGSLLYPRLAFSVWDSERQTGLTDLPLNLQLIHLWIWMTPQNGYWQCILELLLCWHDLSWSISKVYFNTSHLGLQCVCSVTSRISATYEFVLSKVSVVCAVSLKTGNLFQRLGAAIETRFYFSVHQNLNRSLKLWKFW